MGYLHINNLYKEQAILECGTIYALEKIHGTSAHIHYEKTNPESTDPKSHQLTFFSGGEKHDKFKALFDEKFLDFVLFSFGLDSITVYGEAYGGKCQGMKATYGDELKFVVFDVRFNGKWLSVPEAENVAKLLKLEFVDYVKIKADIVEIDAQRDRDSTQAIRNGVGAGKRREGVVLRPLEELFDERGNRIIAKHKNAEFCETRTVREVSPEKGVVLKKARAIADEWVTPMRLQHIIDGVQVMLNGTKGIEGKTELGPTDTKIMIEIMVEDIKREAKGEIVESEGAIKAIGSRTAKLYHQWLNSRIGEKCDRT